MDPELILHVSHERLSGRQIDELIGLARGLAADGKINQQEVEFLQKWLAAHLHISGQPLIHTLYRRINEILADGIVDEDEKIELLDTLNRFSNRDFELGETLKSSTLPLCNPAPHIEFEGQRFCFTGTFNYGQRKDCERAVEERGGVPGSITQKTNYLVIGVYATDSWKHSAFGNKILKAAEFRDAGHPVRIVSEEHWVRHL
ncbi:BRCT domain-containing protein [Chelativorans sp. J32]|uniref:BRCT domain-containing protein n=1 Tax=Chelativorans sp. J32 TaxID=935840 RepID=UPI0004B676E3|nr:BRCT domain-containing protein [Chelativorans sp. J32]